MAKYIKTEEGYKQFPQIDGYSISDWSMNDETDPAFIKNRTHYIAESIIIPEPAADGTDIYWTGPTGNEVQGQDYFVSGTLDSGAATMYAYKVSNKLIPFDELDNIKISEILTSTDGKINTDNDTSNATIYTQEFVSGKIKGYMINDMPAIISVIQETDLSSIGQNGIASIGTYFLYVDFGDTVNAVSYLKHEKIKQLDLKYIPDIAFGTLEMSKEGTTATINYTDRNGNLQTINVEDGVKPVRGTDYWTEADKAEIKAYVDNAILGGVW